MQEELENLIVDPSTGLVAIPATSEAAITLLQKRDDDTTAQRIHKATYSAAPANEEVLRRVVEVRYQHATLVGYANYVDFALDIDPLLDATTVREFLVKASRQAEIPARAETEALTDVLRGKGRPLAPWNLLYAKKQLLKQRLQGIDLVDARKYFPLQRVVPRLLG